VISGINRGPNLGTDIIYSGTCGAARQAALAGIPAIAISCATFGNNVEYQGLTSFLTDNLERLVALWKPDSFININGPSTSCRDLKAVWASPGKNRYFDNIKCFDGADGYTYCFLTEGRQERTPDVFSDSPCSLSGIYCGKPCRNSPQGVPRCIAQRHFGILEISRPATFMSHIRKLTRS